MQTVYLQNDRDIYAMLTGKQSWIRQMGGDQQVEEARKKLTNTRKHIERLKRILAELESRDDQRRAEKLQRQLKKQSGMERQQQKILSAAKSGSSKEITDRQFVTDAYLRTLSRFPTEEEMSRCIEHIKSEENPVNGRIGVMWALINTKEFVVNH